MNEGKDENLELVEPIENTERIPLNPCFNTSAILPISNSVEQFTIQTEFDDDDDFILENLDKLDWNVEYETSLGKISPGRNIRKLNIVRIFYFV